MKFTRRDLVLGSAAAGTLGLTGMGARAAALPSDADVVVIGAGAAGIAAARRVLAANRKVLVIEAAPAIGGRCITDASKFETPFDRGARWLYGPDTNPVTRLARSVELDLYPAPQGQRIRISRRAARAGETETFLASLVRANRAINDAGRGGRDVAAAAAFPKEMGDWRGTAEFLLGPYVSGKDLNETSALDLAMAQSRDLATACRQGVGTLVAKLGAALPVMLSTPVTRIVWSGRDVQVETPAGSVSARAVILTCSTNVLTSGKIRFSPDLPKRQIDAAAALSLGSYDHIALELPGNPAGLARDEVVIEQSTDNRTGALLANLGGTSLCQIDIAGSFGRDLSSRGEAAMVAFAVEWLGKLFGSDIARNVRATAATRWNDMPYVLGAMPAAAPGGQPSRKILMEPLGSLYLAGDAAHETQWGTVGGAWESGERAADAALRRVAGAKDTTATAPARKPRRMAEPRAAAEPRRPIEPPRSGFGGLFWPRN